MRAKKRRSLKKTLLGTIILLVAIMIVVITQITVKLAVDNIQSLTNRILAEESLTYAEEVNNWWSSIEERVEQTAEVLRGLPETSNEDTLNLLLALTAEDPDSQDIYMAYGDDGVFLDGSGWIPDETFVFTDRAWYQGALQKNGAIYTSEPYLDASTGKTCLACAIMIDDNVVLSSDINFDKVAEKVADFESLSPDAKFYIVNEDVAKAADGITEIASGVGKINDVASDNEQTTKEQAENINNVLNLSDRIVSENNKLSAETDNIANISENLNQYSDEINSDLSQYTV